MVVSIIALLATVGVYGIVMLIVRMDEAGYNLIKRSKGEKSFLKSIGKVLVRALPVVIKSLSVIGTLALLLVSGGIFVHNVELFHHLLPQLPSFVLELFVGLSVGFVALLLFSGVKWFFKKLK
jgi:predicted DNA repair protein MutK